VLQTVGCQSHLFLYTIYITRKVCHSNLIISFWNVQITTWHKFRTICRPGLVHKCEYSDNYFVCLFFRPESPQWVRTSSFIRFIDHTQRRSTVRRTPLDEWSARRKYLYLTTHNTHNRQASMSPVGFEPTISAGERPQTYALDRAVTGTGIAIIITYF
jgi:hypothetical protein